MTEPRIIYNPVQIAECGGPCEQGAEYCDCGELRKDSLRDAYDVGYAQALEDLHDVITCIQRKDNPTRSITLEELEAMRPQKDNQ